MTKREEAIEKVTAGMSPGSKKRIAAFLCGKGSINANDFLKYKDRIAEFERIMAHDTKLEDFLEDTKNTFYKV